MEIKLRDVEKERQDELEKSSTFEEYYRVYRGYPINSLSEHEKLFEKIVESAESFNDYISVYKIAKHIMTEGYFEHYTDIVGRAFMNSRKLILSWAFTDEEILEAINVIGQCQEVRMLCLEIIPRLKDVYIAISLLQYINFDDQVKMIENILFKNGTIDQANKLYVASLHYGTWIKVPQHAEMKALYELCQTESFVEMNKTMSKLKSLLKTN